MGYHKNIEVPYDRAEKLIKDGDIFLFRGFGPYRKLLQISGDSPYTHIGMASWCGPILECVEFNEKYGCRSINLKRYNETDGRTIDVYRPVPKRIKVVYNSLEDKIEYKTIHYRAKEITHDFRLMTGLPYGWARILRIALHKLALIRFFYDPSTTTDDTPLKDMIYPVCSTALAYVASKYDYDFVQNKADEWTEPGQIAMSPLLGYVFSIQKTFEISE